MRIENITIKNYKSIKELKVPVAEATNGQLGCTNVLVGINESGKSSILEAMHKAEVGFDDQDFYKICNKDSQDNCKYVDIYAILGDIPNSSLLEEAESKNPTLKKYINCIKIKSCKKNTWIDNEGISGSSYEIELDVSDKFPWHFFIFYTKMINEKK